MHHYWGCTSIYRSLSYPFISLLNTNLDGVYDRYDKGVPLGQHLQSWHTVVHQQGQQQQSVQQRQHGQQLRERGARLNQIYLYYIIVYDFKEQSLNKSYRMSICMPACVYRRNLLTVEPIWFFFGL